MLPRVRQLGFLTNLEHLSNTQWLWDRCFGRFFEGGYGGSPAGFPIDKGTQIFLPDSQAAALIGSSPH